jgi:alcohol dehydrogenase class IV
MLSTITLPRTLRVGGGSISELGELIWGMGLRKPLVVTDAFMVSSGSADKLVSSLSRAGLVPSLFSETVPDPTTDSLAPGVLLARDHDADCVIGFGGGSPMDSAKAIALLVAQGGEMSDYKAPTVNAGPALPIIAVPTTAGTGSEATQFTIITDSQSGEKMLCIGPAFLPVAAVIDFELTLTMPARLTADTGIDALTHAIEAYVSRRANVFSDVLALKAISSISGNLERAYRDGQDREAREAMMFASTQAGMAFSNSSVALVHGMARPLGAHFHVAHGMSIAMLLPAVTAFSVGSAVPRYADCARALNCASDSDPDRLAADKLVHRVARLASDLSVPTPQSFGIDETQWKKLTPLMAQEALASGSPGNNPVVPDVTEVAQLFEQVYA